MLSALNWLALEVKYLDRAQELYTDYLDLSIVHSSETEIELEAGDTSLILRTPNQVPRGGVHTHYAFATPAAEYDAWYDQLDETFDLVEHSFGSSKSLYFDDFDDHCVEIGQSDVDGNGITGIFEIVLEVEDLERAEQFYQALGMDVLDRGSSRRRVRLGGGPVDIELWEPQLGIADARGGVHVDIGFRARNKQTVLDVLEERACEVERTKDAVIVRDPDGHYLTFT